MRKILKVQEELKVGSVDLKNESDFKYVQKYEKHNITDFNMYLFHQGRNFSSYDILGSHLIKEDGKLGIRFTTWAPRAQEVYVTGDFNGFCIENKYKMKKISNLGLWTLFIEGLEKGVKYKYGIKKWNNEMNYKADPYGIYSEVRPNSASVVYVAKDFQWEDNDWIFNRDNSNIYESPVNIYEAHLGSWRTNEQGEFLTYDELSEILPDYLAEMGYTHIEIMPLVEHPLDASWGYQGLGFYSLTSRYGNIEGFKKLVNEFHKRGIGVIMDWAPSHFCKDGHGLFKFDGTATYEYEETWKAENKGWGTCNFDLGRPEVKSFLISNALYWFREFHIDGLRVDAVSNMLYLNYGRDEGEWVPNIYGDDGNLEGIQFLKELNQAVFNEFRNVMMIAEESTSWPNVCKPIEMGGLGFNFKWNMGWMNDSLEYVELDSIYRKYNHNALTFPMMYNHTENFILPISHDEVVHGKKSLLDKMWGDYWTKFAGLRLFGAYMIGHPGKKLLFMGSEFGQFIEWREYEQLEWKLIGAYPIHGETQNFFKELNHIYKENKALYEQDHTPYGFRWIDADNNAQSILSFVRRGKKEEDTIICIYNFTPVVYYDFRVGVPTVGSYEEILNTDEKRFGGSGQVIGEEIFTENYWAHGMEQSIKVKVPPMGAIFMKLKEKMSIKGIEEGDGE
ncbi:MAG: 1,4-alpha-glucan branching protein GlgB [Clostridium sp.]|uniref:1,4-alpha-glucan branching protein GlgB n=1 Tax=Clostridium sp. TaxID=1506 RepID=UPI003F34F723